MTTPDPLMLALFDHLPPAGSVWPGARQKQWLECVRLAMDLVYSSGREMTAGDLGVTELNVAIEEARKELS